MIAVLIRFHRSELKAVLKTAESVEQAVDIAYTQTKLAGIPFASISGSVYIGEALNRV